MTKLALLAFLFASLSFAQFDSGARSGARIVQTSPNGNVCTTNTAAILVYHGTIYGCQSGHYVAAGTASPGVLIGTNDLSDLNSFPTARTNLGLGALAVLNTLSTALLNDATNAPRLTPGDAVVDVATNSFTDEVSATSVTTISAGQTVSWKWVSGLHVVVSLSVHCSADPCASLEDNRFDSGDPSNTVGHRFAYTFTAPGTYYYYCDVHGQMMQGSVIVTAPSIPALKATTGTRYLCIDTVGNITSSASACSGT